MSTLTTRQPGSIFSRRVRVPLDEAVAAPLATSQPAPPPAPPAPLDYMSAVALCESRGLSHTEAIRLVNRTSPELRARYAGHTPAVGAGPATAGDSSGYEAEVERLRASGLSRIDSIRAVNKSRPDLRAKYAGHAR